MIIQVADIIRLTDEFQKREPHAISVWFEEHDGKMFLTSTANDMSKPYLTVVHRYKAEITKDLNFNAHLGAITDETETLVVNKEDNPYGYVLPFRKVKAS